MADDPSDHSQKTPDFARWTQEVHVGVEPLDLESYAELPSGDPLPANLRVCFRVVDAPGEAVSDRVTVMEKPITILGRVEGVADLVLADDATSRYHACVTHRDGEFVLMDMGSTNGTYVNGNRVTEATLQDGDEIKIGVTLLRFEVEPVT